jgi:hypothetical protein
MLRHHVEGFRRCEREAVAEGIFGPLLCCRITST